MTDPYQILGVDRAASADDIRKAYRKLAKQLHPDLHPGDKQLEDRFKEVSAAYDFLSDAEKRRRFDAEEIDASGMERPQRQFYRDFAASGEHPYQSHAGFADIFDNEEVIDQLFRRAARRGADVGYRLAISLVESIAGARRQLQLRDGRTVEVAIPAGVRDGAVLRVPGGGLPGRGVEAGDALIEISVAPHPQFTRHGDDIHMELPISLNEAVLGARIETPTVTGRVLLSVPKGSDTGTVLRLKGKGAPRPGGHGDQLVKLKVVLPPGAMPELEAFLENWALGKAFDPRRERP